MAGSIELDLDEGQDEEEPLPLDTWWAAEGYLMGKEIEGSGGLWICLAEMITTYRVMICSPPPGAVYEFWCYPKGNGLAAAIIAFTHFDGEGDPLDGWVKHHPSYRRRNLETGEEYVAT